MSHIGKNMIVLNIKKNDNIKISSRRNYNYSGIRNNKNNFIRQ